MAVFFTRPLAKLRGWFYNSRCRGLLWLLGGEEGAMRLLWFAIVLMLLLIPLPAKAGCTTQTGGVAPQTVLR